eukprot:706225-Pyramimonas_sp.AAC.1
MRIPLGYAKPENRQTRDSLHVSVRTPGQHGDPTIRSCVLTAPPPKIHGHRAQLLGTSLCPARPE